MSEGPSAEGQDALDEALEILDGTGPEYPPFGFVNHGPMATEALVQLGRADTIVPWAVGYRDRLEAAPPTAAPVSADDWQRDLGDFARFAAWEARFAADLTETTWPDLLSAWVPRLAPGVAADALHGVIRVGHAVRALEARDTPARRHELARGLALWASTYQELPGDPDAGGSAVAPTEAVARVRRITDAERGDAFSIVDGLRSLDGVPDFAPVIGLVGVPEAPTQFLAELGAAFTQVALEQVRDPLSAIVFTHTITGPAALALLVPHLADADRGPAVAYAWQAAAGVYAAFGSDPRPAGGDPAVPATDELIDRAVATGDEHAIKLTEACVRLDDGSGTHLAAAALGVAALEPA